jgi:hypothetical protein
MYYSIRGASYLAGGPLAQLVQRHLGLWQYTNLAHCTTAAYLLTKAFARSFAGQLVSLMRYSCAPMYIRVSVRPTPSSSSVDLPRGLNGASSQRRKIICYAGSRSPRHCSTEHYTTGARGKARPTCSLPGSLAWPMPSSCTWSEAQGGGGRGP